jgi:hypothetical protein
VIDPNIDYSFSQLHLRRRVVERNDRQRRALRQPEVGPAAQLNLYTPACSCVDLFAFEHRQVLDCGGPLGFSGPEERDVTFEKRNSGYTSWARVIVVILFTIYGNLVEWFGCLTECDYKGLQH